MACFIWHHLYNFQNTINNIIIQIYSWNACELFKIYESNCLWNKSRNKIDEDLNFDLQYFVILF